MERKAKAGVNTRNSSKRAATISGTDNLFSNAPQLDDLADNGGPKPTHALLAGSLAIDAGDPGLTIGNKQVADFYVPFDDVTSVSKDSPKVQEVSPATANSPDDHDREWSSDG